MITISISFFPWIVNVKCENAVIFCSIWNIYDRIFRYNWNIDKALTEPVIDKVKYITYGGVTMNYSDWERARGFSSGTISHRINNGASIQDALNTPIKYSDDKLMPINAIYFVDENDKPI